VLYATGNKGKIMEVGKLLEKYGIEVVSPKDLGMEMAESSSQTRFDSVLETGKTLEDNAAIKARAFRIKAKEIVIMADDTGLEIDALGGEPGIKPRRWRDGVTEMSEEEIVNYCLERMQRIPPEARGARLRTVVGLIFPGSDEIEYFDGRLRGLILQEPKGEPSPGLPFETLFYVPEWEMTLKEVRDLPEDKKIEYLTHREMAIEKAVPRILEWFARREES